MSDALDYLLKFRKEAMQAYFQFFKESGKHIDNKTRLLLSVITKVNAQTETGFKQYLRRALREGNTANEVLDALLICIPILGLSKIIWAVDIILKTDIPGFNPELISKKKQWHELIKIDELKDGISRFNYAGQGCFIYKKGDDYQVYDSYCPHQSTNISMSAVNGFTLICPKHHWQFDLTNGECTDKGKHPLNKIKFKIDKGVFSVYA